MSIIPSPFRMTRLAAVLAVASLAAPGYYHFVHYPSRTGPFVAIYEKFDLNALPNKTVFFYVSDQGPSAMAAGDAYNAVVSQIQAAARVWNDVEMSDLRLRFGGISTAGLAQSSPGIDVVFSDEVPPGIVAMGTPTTRADFVVGPNGPMVPILRSVLTLRKDLTSRPSWSEAFFMTVVHEFGHTLGLQHTLTSATMSTEKTRATTKARPLAADDIAGISLLYPTAAFRAQTGSIAGRVTMGTDGVPLASVVAISPNGPAVSALTNPDGTYRIDGIPAGLSYYLYVHPLPPPVASEVSPANVVAPVDLNSRPFAFSGAFDTVFFPNTKDWQQAFPIQVTPGSTVEGASFNVQRRAAVALHAVETFGYPGGYGVKPPYLSRGTARPFIVATGVGLSVNNAPAPGLRASLMNGSEILPSGPRAYAPAPSWVQLDVQVSNFSTDGPRHVVFSLNNDIYILPAAFYLVQKPPPAVASAAGGVDTNGDKIVTVTGTSLSSDTRILFDGQTAAVRSVDETAGRIVVTTPAGQPGGHSAVVALNADGQSSLFLQANAVPGYDFEAGDPAFFAVAPGALPAGVDAMLEINGVNTNFVDGQTVIGFGTSDVAVRRVWVTGPTRLLANLTVAAAAQPSTPLAATVVTGLRIATQTAALQVLPAGARLVSLGAAISAATPGQGLSPGNAAIITVYGASTLSGAVLLLNDRPAPILGAAGNQIVFQIPRDLAPGPAVVRLQIGAESALPVVMNVDPQPPAITGFLNPPIAGFTTATFRGGDVVTAMVAGLADQGAPVSLPRVSVSVAGIDHPVSQVVPVSGQHEVVFVLSPQVPAGTQPLTISIDGRASAPFPLVVR